MAIFVNARASR